MESSDAGLGGGIGGKGGGAPASVRVQAEWATYRLGLMMAAAIGDGAAAAALLGEMRSASIALDEVGEWVGRGGEGRDATRHGFLSFLFLLVCFVVDGYLSGH